MSRIGAMGVLAPEQLSAVYRLQEIGRAIAQNNQRISTLKRINFASDDPAGMVTASRLESELEALDATSQNLSKATALVDTAATAAGQIVDSLAQARAVALEVAGGTLSSSEIAGKQVELDTLLRGIDTLAAAELNGRRLIDGSSSDLVSGVDTSKITNVEVLDKQTASDVAVSISVQSTATRATNSYTGGTLGADATITITGPSGSGTVSLANGDTTQDITDAFNSVSYLTGITATRINANEVDFATVNYGSAATMNFDVTDGTFNRTTSGETAGTDAVAIINGQTVTGDGSQFTYNTSDISLTVAVDPTVSGTISSFTVGGDGLEFAVGSGAASTARLSMPQLNTAGLGGIHGTLTSVMSGGANSLTGGNAAAAIRIIDEASRQATIAQSRLASFQEYTLGSASTLTAKTKENVTKALNDVAGTNIALETSLLANNQLLQAATYQALQMFGERNQSVLSLLSATASKF